MSSIYFARETSQNMEAEISTEQELLQAAKLFDPEALAQIYDLHSPELYRYAIRLLGDSFVAEDCVAETFSRFLKVVRDGRGPNEFLRAYLHRIAHNWIVDYYRRTPDAVELDDSQPDDGNSPEQEIDLLVRQSQMRKALLRLTPEQQKVIVLKYLQDWKNEEIAEALRKPVGAVKSLQHRALASLQKILGKEKQNE